MICWYVLIVAQKKKELRSSQKTILKISLKKGNKKYLSTKSSPQRPKD